jgi:hypothetical protein
MHASALGRIEAILGGKLAVVEAKTLLLGECRDLDSLRRVCLGNQQ